MTSPGNTQTNVFAADNVSSAPTSGVVSGLTNGVAYTITLTATTSAGSASYARSVTPQTGMVNVEQTLMEDRSRAVDVRRIGKQ